MSTVYMFLYIVCILLFFTFFIKESFICVQEETIRTISEFNKDPFVLSTFKPECCPSTYSTSQGCLCINETNYGILTSRGGNRKLDPIIYT